MTTADSFYRQLAALYGHWRRAAGTTERAGHTAAAYARTMEVFADWLEDHDDPRGPGYRLLGRLGWSPWHSEASRARTPYSWWDRDSVTTLGSPPEVARGTYSSCYLAFADGDLPQAWFDALKAGTPDQNVPPRKRTYTSIRAANDDAATAFAALAPDARAAVEALVWTPAADLTAAPVR